MWMLKVFIRICLSLLEIGFLEDPAELEKMYLEKARELKKKVEGKDGGHLANYVDVVKKYEKYSIQELYQKIMEKAKNKKEV